MRDIYHRELPVRFLFPIDGDCLNEGDGLRQGEMLLLKVKAAAPAGAKVCINGKAALETFPGEFSAAVPVKPGRRELALSAEGMPGENISVFWLPKAEKGFRLSVDDNLLFFADLTEKTSCRSIFENPYLTMYRELHEETGVKVHLNLFYQTGDLSYFSGNRSYFDLSRMTDRFKEEWEENADWLKLSFHSREEFMRPVPYGDVEPEVIAGDAGKTMGEIRRFAGEKSLSEATTVHCCGCPIENLRALRDEGVRIFTGFVGEEGKVELTYCYPKEVGDRLSKRHFWVDTAEGIALARIDSILNGVPPTKVLERMEQIWETKQDAHFLEVMIHEQYFYSDYRHYIPEFREMLRTACRFLMEHGYHGQGLSEIFEGVPLW